MGALCAEDGSKCVIPWLHGFDSFADLFLEQTALVGQVSEEFNFLPVENEELRRISEKAAVEAMKPKEKVQYIDDISPDITNAAILLPSNKGHFVVSFRSLQSACIFIC